METPVYDVGMTDIPAARHHGAPTSTMLDGGHSNSGRMALMKSLVVHAGADSPRTSESLIVEGGIQ